MEHAYDPARVRALAQRTLDAIATLETIRSTDPAAADAVRVARLARRNLEELWMPAIRRIQRSDAMLTWSGIDHDTHDGWRRPPGPSDDPSAPASRPLRALSDDELFELVDLIDRLLGDAPLDGERIDTYDANALPAKYDLAVLAGELAARVRADDGFRRRLLAHAPRTVLVGQLVARARFPVGFVADLAVTLAGTPAARAQRDPVEFGRAMSDVLDVLADHPATALSVLRDDAVLHHVATSRHLDAQVVATFTASALTMAAASRPTDGYAVIARVTDVRTGHLSAGFSLGLAVGFEGFFETLAPAIARRDANVVVATVAGAPTIGSYAEVRELFGELLRHADAAAALGASLGAYTAGYLGRLGDDLGRDGTLATLAQLITMIDEATTSEQAQLAMEAGATEADRRRAGEVVRAGATVALTASGVGSGARGIVDGLIGFGTDALARVEPEQLAGASITNHAYQRISILALRTAIARPEVIARFAGRDHSESELDEFARRLDEIDDCARGTPDGTDGPCARPADALSVLEQDLGDDSRVIRFLDHVRTSSGLEPIR